LDIVRVIVRRYAIAMRHDKLQVFEGERYKDTSQLSRALASHD